MDLPSPSTPPILVTTEHWAKFPVLYAGSHKLLYISVQFSRSVMSDSFASPWTPACQASLSITNSRSPPKPMSIESGMPSNRLILCHPLLLLPSVFPKIRVFFSPIYLLFIEFVNDTVFAMPNHAWEFKERNGTMDSLIHPSYSILKLDSCALW